jgi:hypothetical protein
MKSQASKISSKTAASIFIAWLFLSGGLVFSANTDLTEAEKTEKRLQFNRYVEQQLAEIQKEKVAKKKRWNFNFTGHWGYDTNVKLNNQRKGDAFHRENLDASWIDDHEGVGPDQYGVRVYLEYTDYFKKDPFDSQQTIVSPFLKFNFTNTLSLKTEYNFRYSRYIHNNPLTYYGHGAKVTLTDTHWNNMMQSLYGSFERKGFSVRKALTDAGVNGDDERADFYDELGYGMNIFPDKRSVIGAIAAAKFNDSNDIYFDYNDYRGYKVTGFMYRELSKPLTWVLTGGYDYKRYDNRAFAAGSSAVERDYFYYLGNYFYYTIHPNAQIVVSYLYSQNFSNDRAQEYFSHVWTTGLSLTF